VSPARLALLAGVLAVVCVLVYLRQVAKRERSFTLHGALLAMGATAVGVLLVNVGVDGLGVLRP